MNKQGFLIINNSVVIDSSTSITSLPDSAIVEEFATKDDMYQEAFIRGLIDEIPAKEIVPPSITIRQAKLQLLAMGKLADVETITNSNQSLQIEWEYASLFKRDSQVLNDTATAMGLTQDMIDDFFIAASKL